MRRGLRLAGAMSVALALVITGPAERRVLGQGRILSIAPDTVDAIRDWDNIVNRMTRTDELRVRLERKDTLIPGRTIQQLDQYYHGVRVWGGTVSWR